MKRSIRRARPRSEPTVTGQKGQKGQKRQARAERRGVALVMVLGALSILTVLLAEFQEEASAEQAAAIADRDALKAEYLARSAVNLSRLLISAEPSIRAPISPILGFAFGGSVPQLPVWEFSDQLLGAFNDEAATKDFAGIAGVDLAKGKNLGMKGGKFELQIVDEDSKINLNLAAKDLRSQLRLASELVGLMKGEQNNPIFEERDPEGQFNDRLTVCGALVDWTDSDENLFSCDLLNQNNTSQGAEDGYYQLLKNPYRRKNAPFDSVGEAHLVRGINDTFWSTFFDPDPQDPKKRTVTVWGQGTLNVNTANAQTVWAFLCGPDVAARTPPNAICEDPLQAAKFITSINMMRGMLSGFPVFGSPGAFIKMAKGEGPFGALVKDALGIDPFRFQAEAEARKGLSTESKIFSIYANGVVPGFKRTTRVRIHAVVDFRDAPPPGQGFAGIALDPSGGATGGAGGATGAGAATGAAASAARTTTVSGTGGSAAQGDALAGALVKNPGGTIVYFRVE